MSPALILSFDDSEIWRLEKAAADRQVSREELAKDILAAFLDDDEGSDFTAWQATGGERNSVSGLLPWQEERVERGRADIARGAVASEADLDRVRHKYD